MNRKNQRTATFAVLPMYLFSLVFVAGPLVYMLVLSFMTRDGFGFSNAFTLENYRKIFDEVYFATFLESLWGKTLRHSSGRSISWKRKKGCPR